MTKKGVPGHVALIPDGNRRWAEQNGLKPWEGHDKGIQRFKEFANWCYDAGVEHVTAYSLSKENLDKREHIEVEFLFKLYEKYLQEMLVSKDLEEREVRVYFVGKLEGFPKTITDFFERIEEKTRRYKKRTLTLCINYSGREEILDVVRSMIREDTEESEVDEKSFEKHLYSRLPAPDLLVRTAENRISNFMLWQLAYSEIYFSPKLFPDFNKADLLKALGTFKSTERRFGR